MNLVFDILIIFILFALFGYSHSILASRKFKKKLVETVGDKIAFYRLFYNAISVISFIALLAVSPKPVKPLYDLSNPYDLIFFGIQIIGLAGIVWAVKVIDGMEFLGINQIRRYLNGTYDINELDEHSELKIEGPFKYCRHPIYFFSTLILLFNPAVNLWYLVMVINIAIYFYIGSIFEERKLERVFGVKYTEYKNDVPRIIPYKLFNRK
ncbi:MAG: isoprenylcysteine carboxylmethyltransferase family protein [Ignavibacteriae bacterium]|nr:isoprenylcysteine carboxylmethyltransferase family protein [Ignavibacteriota bacterium]NOG99821.1 isoprenylcysteine carboxylmethyltransferase family protein [Ignavibacteriota bacterium]